MAVLRESEILSGSGFQNRKILRESEIVSGEFRGTFGLGTAEEIRRPEPLSVRSFFPVSSQIGRQIDPGTIFGNIPKYVATAPITALEALHGGVSSAITAPASFVRKRAIGEPTTLKSELRQALQGFPEATGEERLMTLVGENIALGGLSPVVSAAPKVAKSFVSVAKLSATPVDELVRAASSGVEPAGVIFQRLKSAGLEDKARLFAVRARELFGTTAKPEIAGLLPSPARVGQRGAVYIPSKEDLVRVAGQAGKVLEVNPETRMAVVALNIGKSVTVPFSSVRPSPATPVQRQIEKVAGVEPGKTRFTIGEMAALKSKLRIQSRLAELEARRKGISEELRVAKGGAIFRERGLRREIQARIPENIALRQSLRRQAIAASQASRVTRNDLQTIKGEVSKIIREGLPLTQRGRLLQTVVSAKTPKDVAKAALRVERFAEDLYKVDLMNQVKSIGRRAVESQQVDVGYKGEIKAILNNFRFGRMMPRTVARLNATQAFVDRMRLQGKDTEVPQKVLDRLKALSRRPISDLTIPQIEVLRDELAFLEHVGRTKLSVRQEIRDLKKQRILGELREGTIPLENHPRIAPKPGETLTVGEKLSNLLPELQDRAMLIDIAISPMDAYFELLDGSKRWGPNFKNFKARLDLDFGSFQDERDSFLASFEGVIRRLGLSHGDSLKIGIHAIRVQPGGVEKLLANGYTQAQIEMVKLTPNQEEAYRYMRENLEKVYPRTMETIAKLENREIGRIPNYFPWLTDFRAMQDLPVSEQISQSLSGFRTKQVEKGFTKKRTGGLQPVQIDSFHIFRRHMDNVSYLNNMQEDIALLFEIANSPEYSEIAGNLGQKVTLDWLDTMARKGGAAGAKQIEALDFLRRNVGAAKLGFKLSSILIQPTALMDGAARIGAEWVFPAFNDVILNRDLRIFLRDNFPELRARIGDDPAYVDLSTFETIAKLQQAGLYLLKAADGITASGVTLGAYRKALSRMGVSFDIKNPNAQAIQEATLDLRRSQVSALFKDIPQAISRGSLTGNVSFDKAILQFRSFILGRWSQIRHDMWRAGFMKGNIAQGANIAFWMTMATATETGIRFGNRALMVLLFGGGVGAAAKFIREEEGEIPSKFLLEAVSTIPFLGDVIQSGIYRGSPIPVADVVTDFLASLPSLYTGKSVQTRQRALTRALEGVASLAGIPGSSQAGQAIRQAIPEKTPRFSLNLRLKPKKRGFFQQGVFQSRPSVGGGRRIFRESELQ